MDSLSDLLKYNIGGALRVANSGAIFSLKLAYLLLDVSQNKSLSTAPRRLREAFEELGATYIKLGQFIASTPSIFPRPFVEEMQKCLDSVRPVPFMEIRKILEKELEGDLSDFFSHIDEKPIASASIAQVHAATTREGLDVVIKVQRPDIETMLKTDMNLIYVITLILETILPGLNKSGISDIISEFRKSILLEVDFIKEAQNIEEFERHLMEIGESRAIVPRVYHYLSTKKVLTMERLYGVPLTDVKTLSGYVDDPQTTLLDALNIWFSSLGTNGFFHADVHAGNLLVLRDGRIGFIDFGIVGRISKEVWSGLMMFMEGLAVNDTLMVVKGLVKMDSTAKDIDERKFAKELRNVFDEIQSITNSLQYGEILSVNEDQMNKVLLDLGEISKRNGLKIPREFGLLMKQMLYFDRYVKALAPEMDLIKDQKLYIY